MDAKLRDVAPAFDELATEGVSLSSQTLQLVCQHQAAQVIVPVFDRPGPLLLGCLTREHFFLRLEGVLRDLAPFGARVGRSQVELARSTTVGLMLTELLL